VSPTSHASRSRTSSSSATAWWRRNSTGTISRAVDVKGKTIIVLVNDPPVPDPAKPGELDPKTFGGRAMTYYGRYTYKYEEAAARGAAGVFVVHETERAGYGFNVLQDSITGEQFDLVTPDKNMAARPSKGGSPSIRRGSCSRWPARISTR